MSFRECNCINYLPLPEMGESVWTRSAIPQVRKTTLPNLRRVQTSLHQIPKKKETSLLADQRGGWFTSSLLSPPHLILKNVVALCFEVALCICLRYPEVYILKLE